MTGRWLGGSLGSGRAGIGGLWIAGTSLGGGTGTGFGDRQSRIFSSLLWLAGLAAFGGCQCDGVELRLSCPEQLTLRMIDQLVRLFGVLGVYAENTAWQPWLPVSI